MNNIGIKIFQFFFALNTSAFFFISFKFNYTRTIIRYKIKCCVVPLKNWWTLRENILFILFALIYESSTWIFLYFVKKTIHRYKIIKWSFHLNFIAFLEANKINSCHKHWLNVLQVWKKIPSYRRQSQFILWYLNLALQIFLHISLISSSLQLCWMVLNKMSSFCIWTICIFPWCQLNQTNLN